MIRHTSLPVQNKMRKFVYYSFLINKINKKWNKANSSLERPAHKSTVHNCAPASADLPFFPPHDKALFCIYMHVCSVCLSASARTRCKQVVSRQDAIYFKIISLGTYIKQSHRFFNASCAPWKSFSLMLSSTPCNSFRTLDTVSNRPFNIISNFENKEK